MNRFFAIHSYKGGTGKSCITANLATTLAMGGANTCLIEYDFRGPSLHSLFKIDKATYWINDYLDQYCDIDEVMIDVSSLIPSGGRLHVALADPNPKRIQEMLTKTKKWEQNAFQMMIKGHESLCKEQGADYLIFDTSPGLQYSSINAIASADYTIVLTKLDAFDFEGTSRMILDIYKLLEKKTGLLINQVVPNVQERIKMMVEKLGIPLLGEIPLFPDESIYLLTEQLMVINYPDHPFSKNIKTTADKLANLSID